MERRIFFLLLTLLVFSVIPVPLISDGATLTHWLLFISMIWAVAAYLLAPRIWKFHFRHQVTEAFQITRTADGHPGDPVNLAIEGSEQTMIRAMSSAGWYPANPITFRSSITIVKDTVLRKPDTNAPVSTLFLFGRKQDLAFELPVGNSPRQRHHVRFWCYERFGKVEPVWYGAATFDRSVGLSHTTGQVTHHIAADVDAERDLIMNGLRDAAWTRSTSYEEGFHKKLEGRNGGGDPWRTDGRLGRVVLTEAPGARQS